jgi:asparagine synthase (glutamine-hydrolysing)
MCGIVGYFSTKQNQDRFCLGEAVRWLHHRGPDQDGLWEDGGIGLGHTRLSIIDLSGGRQPMTSPDGRYVLIFNGEIYNFLDLRRDLESCGEIFAERSDTEVLLRMFMVKGFEQCLQNLRGMFAFAIWDRFEKTLFLARDRLGVKPLVYSENEEGFIFASEIGALFEVQPGLTRAADFQALDHYLTFQYIPAPMSGFSQIRKLPPAQAMIVKEGKIQKIWRYWQVKPQEQRNLPFPEACEALREKFLEATRIRLISDVPLGAFLSGGIDSSITVAAMAKLGVKPVETFSIGFEQKEFNELPYARQISRHLETAHHEMIVKPSAVEILPQLILHLGEPLADNSILPTYYVSEFARRFVTVALTGDGGDEVFGGYRRFHLASLADVLERYRFLGIYTELRRLTVFFENLFRQKREPEPFPSTKRDEILFQKGMERYKHLLAFILDKEKARFLTDEFQTAVGRSTTSDYLTMNMERWNGADMINRYLFLDMVTYLPEDILFKVDISSMLNSLECRSPFLDHQLIEFVASLPGRYKLKPIHQHKHLLKETFKDWLPAGFMNRNKMGFSAPMPDWVRGDLETYMQERLVAERTLSRLVNQIEIENILQDHLRGEKSHSKKLWLFLVLAEWIKLFGVNV